jgi:hypothetical protein
MPMRNQKGASAYFYMTSLGNGVMKTKTDIQYTTMEQTCRRHAELDKTTAVLWLEEADLWSKLNIIERRLQILGNVRGRSRGQKTAGG